MKRAFILMLLVLISLLNANFLIDVYHKDYGVIDRTVLVFDTKPNYEILKHESDLQINLHGCRKDASLQKTGINNSKVITGLDYLISEDKVMVMININTSQLLVTGEIYKVDDCCWNCTCTYFLDINVGLDGFSFSTIIKNFK